MGSSGIVALPWIVSSLKLDDSRIYGRDGGDMGVLLDPPGSFSRWVIYGSPSRGVYIVSEPVIFRTTESKGQPDELLAGIRLITGDFAS